MPIATCPDVAMIDCLPEDPSVLLARITELESRLMFQDQTVDQLNKVVVGQELRIARLEALLRRTREQVEMLLPLMHAEPGEDPPPPHY